MTRICFIIFLVTLWTFSLSADIYAQKNQEEQIQKAAESWMPLWDIGKYEESYELLAQDTRDKISKRQWFVYWTGVRKPLGALKSRKLKKAEYIKSLPSMPNQEGALLQYESSFEKNESVLEIFAMMREKDGTWRVANYLSN
jgi:hypothetical protein